MVVRNLAYYKERYKRTIEKFEKKMSKEDKVYWYNRICLMEDELLEGWDWCLHDYSERCDKAKEISQKFAELGYEGGKEVKVRQIDERAGRIYPDLLLGLRREFEKFNENMRE
jgi:hypothetical protein